MVEWPAGDQACSGSEEMSAGQSDMQVQLNEATMSVVFPSGNWTAAAGKDDQFLAAGWTSRSSAAGSDDRPAGQHNRA
jgi:hypothetical protein